MRGRFVLPALLLAAALAGLLRPGPGGGEPPAGAGAAPGPGGTAVPAEPSPERLPAPGPPEAAQPAAGTAPEDGGHRENGAGAFRVYALLPPGPGGSWRLEEALPRGGVRAVAAGEAGGAEWSLDLDPALRGRPLRLAFVQADAREGILLLHRGPWRQGREDLGPLRAPPGARGVLRLLDERGLPAGGRSLRLELRAPTGAAGPLAPPFPALETGTSASGEVLLRALHPGIWRVQDRATGLSWFLELPGPGGEPFLAELRMPGAGRTVRVLPPVEGSPPEAVLFLTVPAGRRAAARREEDGAWEVQLPGGAPAPGLLAWAVQAPAAPGGAWKVLHAEIGPGETEAREARLAPGPGAWLLLPPPGLEEGGLLVLQRLEPPAGTAPARLWERHQSVRLPLGPVPGAVLIEGLPAGRWRVRAFDGERRLVHTEERRLESGPE